ncbi:hypothetical protein ACFPYM_17145, partial [Methylobacterium hispanicum]
RHAAGSLRQGALRETAPSPRGEGAYARPGQRIVRAMGRSGNVRDKAALESGCRPDSYRLVARRGEPRRVEDEVAGQLGNCPLALEVRPE